MLFQGKANLWYGTAQEEVRPFEMVPQVGYTIYPGNVHRLEAVEDSFFLEVSSPESGRTVRLEDDYRRSDEVR